MSWDVHFVEQILHKVREVGCLVTLREQMHVGFLGFGGGFGFCLVGFFFN